MSTKSFLLIISMIFIGQAVNSQNSKSKNLEGKYQSDMQFVELIKKGANKYVAKFTEDCELTTKVGTVNEEGILEIPFLGENQMQYMFIQKTANQIKIWNSNDSPMMQKCNGATLAGIYEKR